MRIIRMCSLFGVLALPLAVSGCWLALAGVGAEAGYVATQEERTVKETVSDQFLTGAVKASLLADPEVSGLDINVDSFKGVVTLRGALRSQSEINRAIKLAQDTDGVQRVESKLALVN